MSIRRTAYAVGILMIALSAVSFFWEMPVRFLSELIGKDPLVAGLVFVLVMFLATVVAPLTTLPLVPLVAPVFGPFTTGLLSITGWTLGAIVAFLIARYAGRPILGRFISLEIVDRYEGYIPEHTRFAVVVLLRMMVPVDILSYALGLFSRISLFEYTYATIIGISYFAFIFAYLGEAALEKNYVLFTILAGLSLLVLVFGWGYMLQRVRKRNEIDPSEKN